MENIWGEKNCNIPCASINITRSKCIPTRDLLVTRYKGALSSPIMPPSPPFLRTRQLFKVDSVVVTAHRSNRDSRQQKGAHVRISGRWKNGVSSRFIFFPRLFHLESLREKIRSIEISNFQRRANSDPICWKKLEKKGEIRLRKRKQNFLQVINIYLAGIFSVSKIFEIFSSSLSDRRFRISVGGGIRKYRQK